MNQTACDVLIEQLEADLATLTGENKQYVEGVRDAYKMVIIKAKILRLSTERDNIIQAVNSVQLVSRRYYKDGSHGDDLLGKEVSDPNGDEKDYIALSITGQQYYTQNYGEKL